MFIKYCVFSRILECLPPLPRQHSVAVNYEKTQFFPNTLYYLSIYLYTVHCRFFALVNCAINYQLFEYVLVWACYVFIVLFARIQGPKLKWISVANKVREKISIPGSNIVFDMCSTRTSFKVHITFLSCSLCSILIANLYLL